MKRIVIFLLVVLTCAFSVSCASNEGAKDETTLEFFKTDEEIYSIETPYCTLKYPVELKDKVNVDKRESNGSYVVEFSADIEGNVFSLYTIIFGKATDGDLIGHIKTSGGEIAVNLVSEYDASIESASAEANELYGEMCESVNTIISNLVYESGMELTH